MPTNEITEDVARDENFCRGCGGHKDVDNGHPIVCWSCWKGEGLPFKPFKYFNGTFAEWLAHIKEKTGDEFNSLT